MHICANDYFKSKFFFGIWLLINSGWGEINILIVWLFNFAHTLSSIDRTSSSNVNDNNVIIMSWQESTCYRSSESNHPSIIIWSGTTHAHGPDTGHKCSLMWPKLRIRIRTRVKTQLRCNNRKVGFWNNGGHHQEDSSSSGHTGPLIIYYCNPNWHKRGENKAINLNP